MRSRVTLTFAACLFACPAPTTTTDAGTPPIITSVTPAVGPITGGTLVTLRGSGFLDGASIKFDDVLGAQVSVEATDRLTVRSPAMAMAGTVAVTITNPDGRQNTLANAFRYEDRGPGVTISNGLLMSPAETTDSSGQALISLAVIGHVEAGVSTRGTGQGAGVRAQVGFAAVLSTPPSAADFSWADATYQGDADGAAVGDLARDVYAGIVKVPGTTGASDLIYFLAVRFSVDGGLTWTLGDRDGSTNGIAADQLARLVVTKQKIDWCKLGGEVVEAPPTISLRGATAGPIVYGQVYKAGVTNLAGAGGKVRGQLGYGGAGTAPSSWTWADATFNRDSTSAANDEFKATLPNPGAGTYRFAYRFNFDDGPWTYCDADGLAKDGFTEAQAGTLAVAVQGIDRCLLQFPSTLSAREGRPAGNAYGRVYVQGVTDLADAGVGVEGELGFGPQLSPPTDSAWNWTAGAFNVKAPNGGDEYTGSFAGPAPGTWSYAWRFRLGAGTWEYCDRDGSENGFQAAQAGTLTSTAFEIDQCTVDATNSSQTVITGATSLPYRAQVTVATLTELTGQAPGLLVEVGTGAAGSTPSSWTTWASTTFVADQGLADQYEAALAGSVTGVVDVAFRARLGTKPAVYCDRDGSSNGFQSAQAAHLSVVATGISACRLETVSSSAIKSGDPLTATLSIQATGTADAGAALGLRAQIGIGPEGTNASTSALWGWAEAAFSSDTAGRDVFGARVFPAYTGTRAISARATLDDGGTWTWCDLNGSEVAGYEVAQQYNVGVATHTDLAFCNLQFPATISSAPGSLTNAHLPDDGGLVDVYGQVYETGVTPHDAGVGLFAELGFGPEPQDPGAAWTWVSAPFSANPGASPNNNEYRARVRLDAGTSYIFRFSRDGGTFCFGDRDGAGRNGVGLGWGGVAGGANIGLAQP